MDKRERMLMAFAHKEGDTIPKGEISIEGALANRLLYTDYPLDYQHYERDKEIRGLLNIDFVNLGDWPSELIGRDEKGREIRRSVYGYEFMTSGQSRHVTKPPVADIDLAHTYKVPDISKVSNSIIRRFREETDLFVMGQISGPVTSLDEMFPMEDFLVYSLTNTKELRVIAERVMEHELRKAMLFIDAGADAILLADDIAFNSGPLLTPAVMNELVFPFYRQATKELRRYKPDLPIVFHSDGNLNSVLDTIADCGFSGLHSIQPSAGMNIAEVKRRYGDALTLIGNIDLDYILTFAPPEEVERNVRETIDIAAPGGGFVLATCNALISAIPDENVYAMYKTAEAYSRS